MQRIIKYSVLIFLVLILISNFITFNNKTYLSFGRFLPQYNLSQYPPKILVYSSMTSEYLQDHAKELYEKYGFDGFILTQLPTSWPVEYDKLISKTEIIKKANHTATQAGIKYNFLEVDFEQGEVPLWEDEAGWQRDLAVLTKTAAWAKACGFRGIAFDTESYHKLIWNNGLSRNNKVPHIEKLIEKRGTQVVQAVLQGFPQSEILIFPEGHLFAYTSKKPHKYAYWINFFNGMLLAHPPHGVDLLGERMYVVSNQLKLRSYYQDILGEIIAANVSEPAYWLNSCSIAFGMWPLGREYDDKRANLSALQFNEQVHTSAQYCQKYLWVYAHGLSWWQTTDGQKYGFNVKEAALPTVHNLDQYQKSLLQLRDINLKYFYKELKYNHKYSLLNRIIDRLMKIK